MIAPKFPTNEAARQKAVDTYFEPSELSKEVYDNITSLVAIICKTPYAIVSILNKNRNEFYSSFGIGLSGTTRAESFCGHTILSDEDITIVSNASIDERFVDNPFVINNTVKFYAGVPIVTQDGFKLGTLCVYDSEVRNLNEMQLQALKILAKQVMVLLESDRKNKILKELQQKLERKNLDLQKFAGVVSHDLKSPLANIISITDFLEEENKDQFSEESATYIDLIKTSAKTLNEYIEGLLSYYKTDSFKKEKNVNINFSEFIKEIESLEVVKGNGKVILDSDLNLITVNKAALQQIFLNLIGNGFKYNFSEMPTVAIKATEDNKFYYFEVKDNGLGIDVSQQSVIFDLFYTGNRKSKTGISGTGIGLSTVKKVVEEMGGRVSLHSTTGEGSVFSFSILK